MLAAFLFSIFSFIHCQLITSLSGIIIPEVFVQHSSQGTVLFLHINMSNTLKINDFQCQAQVSLKLRWLGPNHFSPQGWQKWSQRRIYFPRWQQKRKNISPWKRTLSKPSQHQPGISRSLRAVPWALLQHQIQQQLNASLQQLKITKTMTKNEEKFNCRNKY